MSELKNLAAALIAATKACSGVAKSGFNRHGDYKYATADDVVKAATGPLTENGLTVVPTIGGMRSVLGTEKGSPFNWLVIDRGFRVLHTSGEFIDSSISWPIPVRGGDGAKAVAAGETGCYAYFLKTLLDMERDPKDDHDNDGHDRSASRGEATQSALPRTSPSGAKWVAKIRSVGDIPDRFAAAEKEVSRLADLCNAGGPAWDETGLTAADIDAMLGALEEKR